MIENEEMRKMIRTCWNCKQIHIVLLVCCARNILMKGCDITLGVLIGTEGNHGMGRKNNTLMCRETHKSIVIEATAIVYMGGEGGDEKAIQLK